MNAIRRSGEPAGDADSCLIRAFFRANIVQEVPRRVESMVVKQLNKLGRYFSETLITKRAPCWSRTDRMRICF
ncbi:hypothetical protein QP794_07270 [Paenibacillus sp. UMB7766-LJ446]|uniref:hypothetical protein n=1 Tax=Paenibacillus sp. UMB7766-LJ446 TaxID=3046313 RepID=UPI00254C59FC|nr:hypothetical protein [Paenibacillus sp. UMB7766-LJ446]MDK8189883.1 hypothetical protein [Paenibacillus sp. UMB7766-LJ446]